jgi:uncharacterized protein YjbI with pentapeptide repeats
MAKRLAASWQALKSHRLAAASLLALLLVVVFLMSAYIFKWDWTGLVPGITQIDVTGPAGSYRVTMSQPGKSLWDWMGLLGTLAIPVVIAVGGTWYTANQSKASDRENIDNQRETALQAYIDKMSELILEKGLRKLDGPEEDTSTDKPLPPELAEARNIARVRTLTVLQRLDGTRRTVVVKFLHESGLIDQDNRIVALDGADLSYTDLSNLDLQKANLNGVNLSNSNLTNTDLRKASLSGVDFSNANLSETLFCDAKLDHSNLSGLDLTKTNLLCADLSYADLSHAILRGSSLSGTKFDSAKLAGADLSGATLGASNILDPIAAATMSSADMTGANLTGADMNGVIMNVAELNGALLVGANLKDADMTGVHLRNADLTGANLDGADQKYALMYKTIMPDKQLRSTVDS